MRETILLAPGANESEFRRTMARFGKPSMGLRVMNGPQLARYALMRAGKAVPEQIISREEELSLVAQAMQGGSYFGQPGLSDIRNIAATLREIRQMAVDGSKAEAAIVSESLLKGPFTEKNKALYDVYERYTAKLRDAQLTDGISLMRKALAESGSLPEEIVYLEEDPLSPLEAALAKKLSGESARKTTFPELFGMQPAGPKIEAYYKAYGRMAEVDTALQAVVKGDIAPDDLLIAVTDPAAYAQLLFDRCLTLGIPVSFGTGLPIGNSYPARLLQRYVHWATDGFRGKTAREELFGDDAFDRSRRPEPFDPALELALLPAGFLEKYARLRPLSDDIKDKLLHSLDRAALKEIRDELSLASRLGQEDDLSGLCAQLLTRRVLRESSRPGAIHICGIREAACALRRHIFVLGLSAAMYPGSPRENHLLLDEDIRQFASYGQQETRDITSDGRIRQKQEDLRALLRIAAALGCKVSLSYPYYDTADLKDANASSLMPEIYAAEQGGAGSYEAFPKALREIRYFDNALSAEKEIGQAVAEGRKILTKEDAAEEKPSAPQQDRKAKHFSPTALSEFYQCPRRFYLKIILGIPEPEDEKPFEIFPANDAGTLAHSLMEQLAEGSVPKTDFVHMAEEAFDQYIKENPPLTGQGLSREKEEFLEMMASAWDQDQQCPRTGIALKEEHEDAVHTESGIGLHGFPDRVELIGPGLARIVDFKTGRNSDYIQDDINTCLQVVVYAYLTEAAFPELKVQDCEYRLIRREEIVSCCYDDAMKQALTDKLLQLREALDDGCFPVSENAGSDEKKTGIPNPCKYCRYGMICGKEEELTEEDEA